MRSNETPEKRIAPKTYRDYHDSIFKPLNYEIFIIFASNTQSVNNNGRRYDRIGNASIKSQLEDHSPTDNARRYNGPCGTAELRSTSTFVRQFCLFNESNWFGLDGTGVFVQLVKTSQKASFQFDFRTIFFFFYRTVSIYCDNRHRVHLKNQIVKQLKITLPITHYKHKPIHVDIHVYIIALCAQGLAVERRDSQKNTKKLRMVFFFFTFST